MPVLGIKISDSLQQGFDAFFAFIPNLIAFLVILIVGFIIAKIVSGIVKKVLEKAGLDKALHESDAKHGLDTPSLQGEPDEQRG